MELATIQTDTDIARAAAYKTLCWGLIYPTEERWSEWSDWITAVRETFSILEVSTNDVLASLDLLPKEEDKSRLALQVEYTRLFINAVPKVVAPPYASAYVDGGRLMGRPAEEAVRAYREAGLEFSTEKHELPDHIAAELEFMYYLTRTELEAGVSGDGAQEAVLREQQRRFLHQHMLMWVPLWRKRLDMAGRAAFYGSLARLTENWLRSDAFHLTTKRDRELEGVNQ